MGVVAAVAGWFAFGVCAAMAWGRIGWNTDHVRKALQHTGYEVAKNDVRHMQRLMVWFGPIMVAFMLGNRVMELASNAGDPHIKHQQQYERRMASYKELKALETEAGSEVTAVAPEAFCVCLGKPGGRRGNDLEVLHKIELGLNHIHRAQRHIGRGQGYSSLDQPSLCIEKAHSLVKEDL